MTDSPLSNRSSGSIGSPETKTGETSTETVLGIPASPVPTPLPGKSKRSRALWAIEDQLQKVRDTV